MEEVGTWACSTEAPSWPQISSRGWALLVAEFLQLWNRGQSYGHANTSDPQPVTFFDFSWHRGPLRRVPYISLNGAKRLARRRPFGWSQPGSLPSWHSGGDYDSSHTGRRRLKIVSSSAD